LIGLTDRFGAFVATAEGRAPIPTGPLNGLKFALKDLVEIAGHQPSCGLTPLPGPLPAADAPVAARLLAAGAQLSGFTTMTPLAYEPSGGNPVQGRPRNPWSGSHICGGSSSGSAVAVAAGVVDFALGSDTGGSLRIPAHCCGVAAWKPTHGLIPVTGTMELAPSLDTLGFLAKNGAVLRQLAEMFDARPSAPVVSVRVARDVSAGCAPDIAIGLERAVSALGRAGLTASDTALLPLIAACDPPVLTVMQAEAARANRARIAAGGLDPVLAARLGKGLAIDDAALAAARKELLRLEAQDWRDLLGDSDAVLLPVMRIRTPNIEVCEPTTPRFSARTLYELSALTRWVNGLGLPAIAIPVGLDSDGLPIAVQLVGRRGADLALLAAACTIQTALAPMPSPPLFDGVPA